MGKPELVNWIAESAYQAICDRASKMVDEATEFPALDEMQRMCLEAGIAAGVTATIKTLSEAGVLK